MRLIPFYLYRLVEDKNESIMSRIDGEDQLGLSVFTSKNGIVYFRV